MKREIIAELHGRSQEYAHELAGVEYHFADASKMVDIGCMSLMQPNPRPFS